MDRRRFLFASAAASAAGHASGAVDKAPPGFASPVRAMWAPPEKFVFVTCSYAGTDVWEPDYLATVDVDPASPRYSTVVSRVPMPVVGDELSRFGWNVCSSSHKKWSYRQYLIVPGMQSGRIHVVDVEVPERLWMHKVIEPTTVLGAGGFSVPYVARPLPTGEVLVSMLGDRPPLDNSTDRHGPGFLLLDDKFAAKGRWDPWEAGGMSANGDFWYQAGIKHPVLVSTAWAQPATLFRGFDPETRHWWDSISIWDWKDPTRRTGIKLGKEGQGPLPVRFLHNPRELHGFVGAVLGGTVWHFFDSSHDSLFRTYKANKVIQVDPVEVEGKLIRPMTTDMVIAMSDQHLYLSNWLHGDVRQYDIGDLSKPKLTGQVFLGGLLGKGVEVKGRKLWGGPQSLQLSLDCKRLYATNSFFSAWDNHYYPEIAKKGSWMVQIDCDRDKGGMKLNENFFVAFGAPFPSRAREVHCNGGDCTSDIFV